MKARANGKVPARWCAVATYRTSAGPVDVTYEFEDLFELHTIIARGPDSRTLDEVRVSPAREGDPSIFLEYPQKT